MTQVQLVFTFHYKIIYLFDIFEQVLETCPIIKDLIIILFVKNIYCVIYY